jgi:glycine oxidase
MAKQPDVLIIGGGVIGLTTAYFLARDGVSVQLLDRSAPGTEASWAGAGIIPPGNPDGATLPYDRLRAASSRMFPELSQELQERTGIDNGYRVCGGIECFDSGSEEAARSWSWEGIQSHPLSAVLASKIEPSLRLPCPAAFVLPGMAQVRNPWHLRALLAACDSVGVQIVAQMPIVRFRASEQRVEVQIETQMFRSSERRVQAAVAESGEEFTAHRFLIAAGAWTDKLLASSDYRTGVHPVRGQIVLFNPRRQLLKRVVCVDKRYLVPREDGRILAGSTEEPKAGFEKRTTESGVAELQRFAIDLVPALADIPIEKSWAGLRPGSLDGLPYMGPVPGWSNAFVAAGHFRSGIQLSPGTARVMAELLTDRPLSLPLEGFRLDRPPALPVASAFRS